MNLTDSIIIIIFKIFIVMVIYCYCVLFWPWWSCSDKSDMVSVLVQVKHTPLPSF